MPAPYPWQEGAWARLTAQMQQGRLPHGLLISGRQGLGQLELAQTMAAAALCEDRAADGSACGRCASCHLLAGGTHPDYKLVAPEEEGGAIRVDKIRDLGQFTVLSRRHGAYKVGIVAPADRLNLYAANGLLKTLEEPSPGVVLVLVSSQPARLPGTIRSRCQMLRVPAPDGETAAAWLQAHCNRPDAARALLAVHHGSPLLAKAAAEAEQDRLRQALGRELFRVAREQADPVAVAEAWSDSDLALIVECLLAVCQDLIRGRLAGTTHMRENPDMGEALASLAPGCDVQRLFQLRDYLMQAMGWLGSSLNARLMLEDLLLTWYQQVAARD